MANGIEEFIPDVWDERIQEELETNYVFAKDCVRDFDKDIKEMGDRVKILGIGEATITHMTVQDSDEDIVDPEDMKTSAIFLDIDMIDYYNFKCNEIKKAQAKGGEKLLRRYAKKAGRGLAGAVDKRIAQLVVTDDSIKTLFDEPVKVVSSATISGGDLNILKAFDKAKTRLLENNVDANTRIVATISPRCLEVLQNAYVNLDTNNSEMMREGFVGRYNGIYMRVSNNVCRTNVGGEIVEDPADELGVNDNIMIRTEEAIAYASQLQESEAYVLDKKLKTTAIKGFILYGIKTIAPKQVINMNIKYA